MIRHLATGKRTCHLSVSLPLDESFGSCLMPSRADVNISHCELDELIQTRCSSALISTATSLAPSATEVESRSLICCCVCQRKNFEIQSMFGKVVVKGLVAVFFCTCMCKVK